MCLYPKIIKNKKYTKTKKSVNEKIANLQLEIQNKAKTASIN